MEDATNLSITVVGGPGKGKSTLLKTMKRSKRLLARVFGDQKEEDRGAEDLLRRTKGISLVIYTTSSGHTIHFRDLAGQQDFSAPHCLFHPFAGLQKAGLIVADGKLSIREIQRDLEMSAGNLICCHEVGKKSLLTQKSTFFACVTHDTCCNEWHW